MMRTSMRGRIASSAYAAVALLAGCGGGWQSPAGSIPQNASNVRSSADESDGAYKTVYSFQGNNDGSTPTDDLIAVDDVLYGVTYAGGLDYGRGTVYKVSKYGKERVIYRFGGGDDGSSPYDAGLVNVSGALYGTTENGGKGCVGCGTVYKTTTDGVEQVVHSFRGGSDGTGPSAPLVAVSGALYGTTMGGGGVAGCPSYGCGIVFKVKPDGANYTVLHRFTGGTDGSNSSSGLVQMNGTLYGTTPAGGSPRCAGGCGTVFKISTSGDERVLYAFKGGRDGSRPQSSLIAVDGSLYGTTYYGGTGNCASRRCGTVFEVSASGVERVIYRFNGGISDGANPAGPLLSRNGTFYGTTEFGGNCNLSRSGCGTIFALYAPGNEKVLHTFVGDLDGAFPQAGLIEFNTALYGTAGAGGSSYSCGNEGCGTVFKLTP